MPDSSLNRSASGRAPNWLKLDVSLQPVTQRMPAGDACGAGTRQLIVRFIAADLTG